MIKAEVKKVREKSPPAIKSEPLEKFKKEPKVIEE